MYRLPGVWNTQTHTSDRNSDKKMTIAAEWLYQYLWNTAK